ncbi:MAG: hypothetical protein ACRD8O_15160 [Bryobacteraceae bacterium]
MRKQLLLIAPLAFLIGCGSHSPVQNVDAAIKDATAAPPATASAALKDVPRNEVAVPAGARLRVRLGETLDTARNSPGDTFTATLDEPVVADGKVILPKGTRFSGRVVNSAPSGRLKGRAVLALALDSYEVNGKAHPISTATVSRASSAHKKRNWLWIGGGSGAGAAVGALAGGGKGALIGAGAGAAAGTAGAAVTGEKNVRLPAESVLIFPVKKSA